MEQAEFESMVKRLERESQVSPARYQAKVGLLALLGFGLIVLIVGIAASALLGVGALVLAMLTSGGKAIVLLLQFGKLLVFLALPCWILLRATFSALFVRLPEPEGIPLSAQDAPALFAALESMRQGMKGPRFHRVLLTDEVNAAVMQRPFLGLFGFPRNYLILGLPLLESLSPAEMLAVVAHEYGHLAGSHGHFGAFVYRLRQTWAALQELSTRWSGWGGYKLHCLVCWYAPYFNAYTFVLARANEYQADAAAAELAGRDAARAALKRLNLAAARHQRFMDCELARVGSEASPPVDLALRWASIAAQASTEQDAPEWLAAALARTPHYADTHPALRQRLAALGHRDQSGVTLPPPLNGPTAARSWLGEGIDRLRDAVQQRWRSVIADCWQTRHQEIKTRTARLDALRALAAPSEQEEIERLHLQAGLEPGDDALQAVAAFNAACPDRAITLFLHACMLLDRGERHGLILLDHVMELDSAAVPSACERACAFLGARDEERAHAYAARLQAHRAWIDQRAAQIASLDVAHALEDAALDATELAQIRTLLRANQAGISRAWLARRVIPADPQARTYVLGIELKCWAKYGRQHARIVKRLIRCDWPLHAFVCTLDQRYKPLRARFSALAGAELSFRD